MTFHGGAPLSLVEDEDGTNILLSTEEGDTSDMRLPPRRTRTHMVVAVLSGIAFVVAAVFATRSTTPSAPAPLEFDTSANDLIQESSGCGGPFEQCGGTGFTGAACCKAGCVCEPKNEYFHKCSPASHSTQCDPAAAQTKADSILRKAIPYQAKAYDDAKKKAAAARKAADAAEKLLESEKKAAAVAEAEERAATEAFHAIQAGNGAKWVKAVYHQGGVAKKAKELSDAAAADFTTLEDAEASRALVANNLVDALPKAEKFAGPEKLWADNLADDAHWTMIGDNFEHLPDDSGDEQEDEAAPDDDKSSSGGADSKLVGGVYYTR